MLRAGPPLLVFISNFVMSVEVLNYYILDSGGVKLENLLDRSSADVRGVKTTTAPVRGQSNDGDVARITRPNSRGDYPDQYGEQHLSYPAYEEQPPMRNIPERRSAGDTGGHPAQVRSTNPYYYSPDVANDVASHSASYRAQTAPGGPPRRSSSEEARSDAPLSAAVPTIAGQANKKGGIYDRLSNPNTFTGVSYCALKNCALW